MKKFILLAFIIPAPAWGQYPNLYNAPGAPIYRAPVVVAPNVQTLPLPAQRNPYGTGYSIVTRTETHQDESRDVTDSETVTSIRPNDAWGNPIKPIWEILEDAGDGDGED